MENKKVNNELDKNLTTAEMLNKYNFSYPLDTKIIENKLKQA